MPHPGIVLPARIETARLILRCYEPGDERALDGEAMRSVEHIGRYLPNARAELLGDRVALIAEARRAFLAAERFAYGLFLRDGSYVGNCGATRVGDDALNIAYWVLQEHLRKGYTSEAVRAVTATGFAAGVRRFVLNCDVTNEASQGVARSAGFTHIETHEQTRPGGERFHEMTWRLESRATAS